MTLNFHSIVFLFLLMVFARAEEVRLLPPVYSYGNISQNGFSFNFNSDVTGQGLSNPANLGTFTNRALGVSSIIRSKSSDLSKNMLLPSDLTIIFPFRRSRFAGGYTKRFYGEPYFAPLDGAPDYQQGFSKGHFFLSSSYTFAIGKKELTIGGQYGVNKSQIKLNLFDLEHLEDNDVSYDSWRIGFQLKLSRTRIGAFFESHQSSGFFIRRDSPSLRRPDSSRIMYSLPE